MNSKRRRIIVYVYIWSLVMVREPVTGARGSKILGCWTEKSEAPILSRRIAGQGVATVS